MIKRNILAIVIPALLIGMAEAAEIFNKDGNKLDLYGSVNVRRFFLENDRVFGGDSSYINLGINGNTQISDNIVGFGRFEFSEKTGDLDSKNYTKNNLSYIGLKFDDFGSFDYGYNYGLLHDIKNWTDFSPLYKSSYVTQVDNYLSSNAKNSLTYRNEDFFGLFDGLNFAIQYQENKDDLKTDDASSVKNDVDGFGVSANYDTGFGLKLGGAYSKFVNINKEEVKEETDNKNPEGWDVGVKYDSNNFYLAAMYGETYNLSKFSKFDSKENDKVSVYPISKMENFELIAQYLIDDINLKPSVSYVHSIGEGLSDISGDKRQSLIKYVSVGAFYSLNKNLTALVDYKFNLMKNDEFISNNNLDIDNMLGFGLSYKI